MTKALWDVWVSGVPLFEDTIRSIIYVLACSLKAAIEYDLGLMQCHVGCMSLRLVDTICGTSIACLSRQPLLHCTGSTIFVL